MDSTKIIITKKDKEEVEYMLDNFNISNQGTIIHQKPIVKKGDKVTKGDIIADGPSMGKRGISIRS